MALFDSSEDPQARHALIFARSRDDGERMADLLSKGGCTSKIVNFISVAKKEAQTKEYDVIFSFVTGLSCDGMEYLKWLQNTIIDVRRVGIAMKQDVELTCEVFKLGVNACFYFHSIERDILAEHMDSMFSEEMDSQKWYERRSTAFKECGDRILAEAKSRLNLLIIGESGSGKCSIARIVHNHGESKHKSFVTANCVGFNDAKEAYDRIVGTRGLEKNAIYRSQLGLLAQSNGGTLLVDHVDKLPLDLQEMFVEIIESGTYFELSANKNLRYTGRMIFTASENLEEKVREGEFSARLYFAIRHNVMRVPSLAECHADIIPLAEAFITEFCLQRGLAIPSLTKGAEEKLVNHIWLGNIRELYSTISSAVTACRGTKIGIEHISLFEPYDGKYHHSEEYRLKKALKESRGNITQTGIIMGINRTTVNRKMKRYKLNRMDFVK